MTPTFPSRSGHGLHTVASKDHPGLNFSVCLGCNPQIHNLEMEGATHYSYYVVPATCPACSEKTPVQKLLDGWAEYVTGFVLYPQWALFKKGGYSSVEHKVCRLGITDRFLQNLHNFTNLKMTEPKRDISSPFTNTLDASSGVPGEIQTMIFHVLGSMSLPAQQPAFSTCNTLKLGAFCTGMVATFGMLGAVSISGAIVNASWVWRKKRGLFPCVADVMAQFTCTMRATQFLRESQGNGDPRAPSTFARLKVVWDRINGRSHDGLQVYLDGPRTVLKSVTKRPPLDLTPESSTVMQQAEPMPEARPPAGVVAAYVERPNVTIPGPVVEMSVAHDPKGVSHSVESRTEPTKDSSGNVRKFKANSPTGKRMAIWAETLLNVIDEPMMKRSFLKLFGEKQLGEIADGAFTKDQMAEFVSKVQLFKQNSDFPVRKANGKAEIIPKDGKDVRSVVDNTGEVFTAVNCAGKVLENLCFDPVHGLFRDVCIKHRTRNQISDEITEKFCATGCYAWEIDQTRMEAHVRCPGSMRYVIKLLEKVMAFVMTTFSGQLTHAYKTRLLFDQEKGMRIRMSVHNVCVPGNKKTVTLAFSDFYLDSGWLLTSLCNFLLETGATTSACVANPQHMFARAADGELHLMKGTFNWKFRALPIDGQVSTRPIHFYIRTEGDDGAGQISAHAGSPEKLAELVRSNMDDLGFDAKFKIIQNGRLEFVGLHALVRNGKVDSRVPIIPALKRSLGKLGKNFQPDGRTPDQLAAADALRCFSIGQMFSGKIPAVADIFKNCGENAAMRSGKELDTVLYHNEWSAVGRAYGAGHYSLRTVRGNFSSGHATAPPASVQVQAMAMSTECDSMDSSALAKLELFAQDCLSPSYDHMSCYLQLPAELRDGGGAN